MGKAKSKTKRGVNVKSKVRKFAYKKEHVKLAVEELVNGASVAKIARKYNIPESTLRDKKNCKYADKSPGPATVLSSEEESDLVSWIFHCHNLGFPVTKRQLLESVQLLCDYDNKQTPFVSNMPGRSWFNGFLQRHPEISQRIAENITLSRAKVAEYNIREWFAEITKYFTSQDILSIHPSRIFTAHENCVPLNPKPLAALTPEDCKNVFNINSNKKEDVTVLIAANAEGTLAPPLVLFAGKSLPKDAVRLSPVNYSLGFCENGWMSAKNFFEYVTNVFYPWLEESGIELPIILYIDGHSSHITLPLSQFCAEKNIVLVTLFPNAIHILQPLEVFFRPFKVSWEKSFQNFCESNETKSITKSQFTLVLDKALTNLNTKKILENGFEACGLYPLNVNALNFNKTSKRMQNNSFEVISDPEETSSSEIHQDDEVLKALENFLDKEKLELFRSHTGPIWTGEIEDTNLFKFWHSIKISKDVSCIFY